MVDPIISMCIADIAEKTSAIQGELKKRLVASVEGLDEDYIIKSATDGAALLDKIQTHVYEICNDLSYLRQLCQLTWPNKADVMIALQKATGPLCVMDEGKVIIKTPLLHRSGGFKAKTVVPYRQLIEQAIETVPTDAMEGDSGPLLVYSLSVYPGNKQSEHMIDPDNLALKPVIDVVAKHLHFDDNGDRITLVVGALRSDELDAGTYTVFMPLTTLPSKSDVEIMLRKLQSKGFL